MRSWWPRVQSLAAHPGERRKMKRKSPKKRLASPSERYYTTTEAARICGFSHRTIAKLFDAGLIRGYRLPGSGFRRIPEKELLAFTAAHGMPASGIDSSPARAWLHCWEYRRLHKQRVSLCENCEVQLSHIRYCWRLVESGLPVCRYRKEDCHDCQYFLWASSLTKESPSAGAR